MTVIAAIKAKVKELGLDFGYIENEDETSWDEGHPLDEFLLQGEDDVKWKGIQELKEFLKQYGYKHILYSGHNRKDYDDWSQGSDEYGCTVIELNGKFYKLEYNVSSHGGIECDDYWAWNEATKVDRSKVFYE